MLLVLGLLDKLGGRGIALRLPGPLLDSVWRGACGVYSLLIRDSGLKFDEWCGV